MKKLIIVAAAFLLGGGCLLAEQISGDRVKVRGDVVIGEGEIVRDATAILGNLTVNGTADERKAINAQVQEILKKYR